MTTYNFTLKSDTVSGFKWTTENEVSTDQTPTTADLGERYLFTQATAAARTLTLPSVGATEDGDWLAITNNSKYPLTITASDSDTIGFPELTVQSIEIQPNTHTILRYDDSNTKWDIVMKVGNKLQPAGSKAYWKMENMEAVTVSASSVTSTDETKRNLLAGTCGLTKIDTKFGNTSLTLDGSTQNFNAMDSTNWDLFASNTDSWTISMWVQFDDIGTSRVPISQWEDINNRWYLLRTSGNAINFQMISGGVSEVLLTGGTIAASTWYHIAVCKVGAETGLYIDGTQVAYDATFTPDSFAGALYIGQAGNSTAYLDGKLQDIAIVNQNIFGAAPNATPNDTFTVPTNQLNLVI